MKRTLLFISLAVFAASTFAQKETKRYAVKSGHVEYELTGVTNGTRSYWWDDYGDKTYERIQAVTETNVFGMTNREEENSIEITVGDQFWFVDLNDNTGQKGKMAMYDEAEQITSDMSEEELKHLEDSILEMFNGEKTGTEKVLGFDCDIYEVMGATSWIHKGVILKSSANVFGIKVQETAKSFDKNCNVPASKFKAPTNVEYTEVSEIGEMDF